ncbi:MAG: hypothetical protein R2759_01830 [Bacteroidales bacterium]
MISRPAFQSDETNRWITPLFIKLMEVKKKPFPPPELSPPKNSYRDEALGNQATPQLLK